MRKLVLAALLAALPATAAAGSTLEAAIAQATWQRTVDSTLQSVAAVRVIEIQTTFAHRAMPELSEWSWGEVIAWNTGYVDPITQAVIQWTNSPDHWAVLTSGYTDIGCATALSGTRTYFVCLLGIPPAGPSSVPEPGPAPQLTAEPIVDVLPDAATLASFTPRELVMMVASSFLAAISLIAAAELKVIERFWSEHPEIERRFEQWRRKGK